MRELSVSRGVFEGLLVFIWLDVDKYICLYGRTDNSFECWRKKRFYLKLHCVKLLVTMWMLKLWKSLRSMSYDSYQKLLQD
ncbi:hypothetical protein BVRB_1g000080 [Beta vulgaris subsp. vulgaris]|nr:hypothetical protein BVRB_1g000080 [Beta vulgaris subsp. vulgaris]